MIYLTPRTPFRRFLIGLGTASLIILIVGAAMAAVSGVVILALVYDTIWPTFVLILAGLISAAVAVMPRR